MEMLNLKLPHYTTTNDYYEGYLGVEQMDWSQSSPSNHVLTYYFGVAMASNDPNYPAGVTALNGSPMVR